MIIKIYMELIPLIRKKKQLFKNTTLKNNNGIPYFKKSINICCSSHHKSVFKSNSYELEQKPNCLINIGYN